MLKHHVPVLAVSLLSFGGAYYAFRLSSPAAPTIAFPPKIDLGLQDENRRVETSIVLTNRGRETLRVYDFRTSCGCLAVLGDSEQGRIGLGEENIPSQGSLTVQLLLSVKADSNGLCHQTISFRSNDPDQPEITIPITARVQHQLRAEPPEMNLGVLRAGESVVRSFHIFDRRIEPSNPPFVVSCSCSTIQARIVASDRMPEAERVGAEALMRYTVEVTVSPPADGKNFCERMSLLDAKNELLLSIPIAGSVQADLFFAPSAIALPRQSRGHRVYDARCLFKSNIGSCTLRVVESPPGIKVSVSDSAPDGKLVAIKCGNKTPPFHGTRRIVFVAETSRFSKKIEIPVSLMRVQSEER